MNNVLTLPKSLKPTFEELREILSGIKEIKDWPNLIVVSKEQWDTYYGLLSQLVRDQYERNGHYWYKDGKTILSKESLESQGYTKAISYRGIPVVVLSEDEMIRKYGVPS